MAPSQCWDDPCWTEVASLAPRDHHLTQKARKLRCLCFTHIIHHVREISLEVRGLGPSGTLPCIACENNTLTIMQTVRSYATEAAKGGSSSTPFIVGGLAVASGMGGYMFLGKNANADAPPSKDEAAKLDKRAFTGGDQGFIDLKLKEAKDYNHNTKRFIFELPESEQVSGRNVACELFVSGLMCLR
jgi:hypothetical protein